jgi:ABC-2 type transport system ATP-binding protein
MLQRAGLAQALIADPELVILDEPLSGLDPIGRKELKDIIVSLQQRGKTVFFSSHILADIELLCDRLAIVDKGLLKYFGPTSEFVLRGQKEVEVIASNVTAAVKAAVAARADSLEDFGDKLKLLASRDEATAIVELLVKAGAQVDAVVPRSESLEEIFVRTSQEGAA